MLRNSLVVAGFALFAVGLPASGRAAVVYQFTSFDGPGNNAGGTTVGGINNNGQVVGFSSDNAANPTLFTNFIRNTNGTFTVLNPGGDPLAMANGISNSQTVVGGASNSTAFVISGGVVATLPAVTGTTTAQAAFGINDNGLIVGQFTDNNTGNSPGFLRNGGVYTILSPVANGLVTNAQGVNNNGLVAGFYSVDGVHQHGFLYNSATDTYSLQPDPNVANLELTQFLGINDSGIVAGYYQLPDGSQRGLLYDSNTHTYTFLDDPNAATTGVSITQITSINNAGEIAGFYVDSATGLQRGFIATPVPEPAGFGLFAGLILAQLTMRPLRRR